MSHHDAPWIVGFAFSVIVGTSRSGPLRGRCGMAGRRRAPNDAAAWPDQVVAVSASALAAGTRSTVRIGALAAELQADLGLSADLGVSRVGLACSGRSSRPVRRASLARRVRPTQPSDWSMSRDMTRRPGGAL